MPRHIEGHRVKSMEAIKRGGDYFVKYAGDGRIESVWFSMPGFQRPHWNHINGPASEHEPRWEVTEGEGGKITVSPSIRSQWTWGPERSERCFHCFLCDGTWEILDDTVGATWDDD